MPRPPYDRLSEARVHLRRDPDPPWPTRRIETRFGRSVTPVCERVSRRESLALGQTTLLAAKRPRRLVANARQLEGLSLELSRVAPTVAKWLILCPVLSDWNFR